LKYIVTKYKQNLESEYMFRINIKYILADLLRETSAIVINWDIYLIFHSTAYVGYIHTCVIDTLQI